MDLALWSDQLKIENQLTLWGVFWRGFHLWSWRGDPKSQIPGVSHWLKTPPKNPRSCTGMIHAKDIPNLYIHISIWHIILSIYITCIPMRFPWHSHSTIPVIPAPPTEDWLGQRPWKCIVWWCQPLWTISVGMTIPNTKMAWTYLGIDDIPNTNIYMFVVFPNIWKNIQGSKQQTRYIISHLWFIIIGDLKLPRFIGRRMRKPELLKRTKPHLFGGVISVP